jgi:hypothetical protein
MRPWEGIMEHPIAATVRWYPSVTSAEVLPGHRGARSYLGQSPSSGVKTEAPDPGPQAFLVEFGSGVPALGVHYHSVDQFQLIVSGTAMVGGHAGRAKTVHYSDCFTPYGPLRPGEGGVAYCTLRNRADAGARYMPAGRDDLRATRAGNSAFEHRRRNATIDLAACVAPPGEWCDARRDDDGLRIAVIEIEPGGELAPCRIGGGGAYAVILEGSVDTDGLALGPGALTWAASGTEIASPGRSTTATRIALLQFPNEAGAT